MAFALARGVAACFLTAVSFVDLLACVTDACCLHNAAPSYCACCCILGATLPNNDAARYRRLYQKRVGDVRLLGELYNYVLLDSGTLMATLYLILGHGRDSAASAVQLDPPGDCFRIRCGAQRPAASCACSGHRGPREGGCVRALVSAWARASLRWVQAALFFHRKAVTWLDVCFRVTTACAAGCQPIVNRCRCALAAWHAGQKSNRQSTATRAFAMLAQAGVHAATNGWQLFPPRQRTTPLGPLPRILPGVRTI